MVEDIFEMLSSGINFVSNLFDTIMNETGFFGIIIGLVSLLIFFRLIITPLFAGRIAGPGSDPVKPQSKEDPKFTNFHQEYNSLDNGKPKSF